MTATAQAAAALASANEIRLARASHRREIADAPPDHGVKVAVAVVVATPSYMHTCTAHRLLIAIHGVGPGRARAALRRAGVSEIATLSALTPRQRGALVEELRLLGENPRRNGRA